MVPSAETENIELERGMIECAVAEARRLGAKLVQTVLEKEDWPRQTAFRDAGFEPLAELSFMERHPQRADCAMEAPPWLRFITYEKDREGVFLDVIRSTYEGTLDCPALSSLRTAEETLEGHKRSGKFDPLMWFLAFDKRNTPVGVLLLNLMEISDRFNVTFMGVVAEFRGRGLGMAFVKYALRRICETHRTVLTLAVDTRNWPACRIYKEAGFVETARKEVLYRYF
jgi:ribosomal protein S18 acetylase RimI-like enzyme